MHGYYESIGFKQAHMKWIRYPSGVKEKHLHFLLTVVEEIF